MEDRTQVILAISAGTWSAGFAVLKNGRLIDWNVKTFTGKWNKEKSKRILDICLSLMKYYSANTVVLKKVDPVRSSVHLLNLVDGIRSAAVKQKRKVSLFTIYDLQEYCGGKSRNIRKHVAETAVSHYPELRHEYLRELNSFKQYYQRMFEAVVSAKRYQDK